MAPHTEEREAEEAFDLGLLTQAEDSISSGYQPSREMWENAAKTVVAGTLNSLSDIALAVYGSNSNTPVHSLESFVDDGTGPNRHIPAFLRRPEIPPSVLAVIRAELPDIDVDAPACHRAAANTYGFWCCPAVGCDYFIDVAYIRPDELAFLRQYDVGVTGILVQQSGVGRVLSGNPGAARAVLQLLACRHFECGHLSRRGLEMVVCPTVCVTDGVVVTWRWKSDWAEFMPDIQDAVEGDERLSTHRLRQWLSQKGARVSDRLRRPLWVKYRLWARADRAHRQQIVRAALDAGQNELDVALTLFLECRLADLTDANADAFEAHARAEELDCDVVNFQLLPMRPWPREYPTWGGLSDDERQEIMNVYATGNHQVLLECEQRIYNYPWLADW